MDPEPREELRRRLGRVGVWSFALDELPAAAERQVIAEIEGLGYPAIWFPETIGSKEMFSHASLLLSAGSQIMVCSGIANVWARDPMAMANGWRTLSDAHPDRFVLGMGVSHKPSVEARGQSYVTPRTHMREYIDAMDTAATSSPEPAGKMWRLLAALGPRMLELAAERAFGAHPYFVPVEHTALARRRLGPAPVLAVELTVVLETDAEDTRRIARRFAARYLGFENYSKNLRRLGWDERDLAGGGSDKLIDAVIACGDVGRIRDRVKAHLDAGADHVCVQVRSSESSDPSLRRLRELAPALLDL